MNPHIVFFGTPEFAVPTLEALVTAGYTVVAVVTQPDKPVGRGLKMEAPAVKKKAEELGITVLQPPSLKSGIQPKGWSTTLSRGLQLLKSDIGIAVAYGKIIPKEVIDLFPRGILNIHPSLLPKYRGPSPIQAAILSGDTETGVTIMLLDEEMDHGAILAHAKIAITQTDTDGSLNKTLSEQGAKLLMETLPKWLDGKIKPQPQDHAKATCTKRLTREDGRIDWRQSAEYIERLVRAYDPWPGTWTLYKNTRLKILRVSMLHPFVGCASNATPGYVWQPHFPPLPEGRLGGEGAFAVNCNPGSIILEQLQLPGKKQMSSREFIRGHSLFLGSVL